MKALDTNVLVRFLVADDPAQAARARSVVESAADSDQMLFLPVVVLLETAWVLESCYGHEPTEVGSLLEGLLEVRQFAIEARPHVRAAFTDFADGRGDLADCLIGRMALANACETTLTFDRGLSRNTAFTQL